MNLRQRTATLSLACLAALPLARPAAAQELAPPPPESEERRVEAERREIEQMRRHLEQHQRDVEAQVRHAQEAARRAQEQAEQAQRRAEEQARDAEHRAREQGERAREQGARAREQDDRVREQADVQARQLAQVQADRAAELAHRQAARQQEMFQRGFARPTGPAAVPPSPRGMPPGMGGGDFERELLKAHGLDTGANDSSGAGAPYLGVSTSPAPQSVRKRVELPDGIGLVVSHVEPGSPAEGAGLKQYDILHKLNDQLLVNMEQLSVLVRTHKPGEQVRLSIVRGGRPQELTAKLGERRQPPQPTGPAPGFQPHGGFIAPPQEWNQLPQPWQPAQPGQPGRPGQPGQPGQPPQQFWMPNPMRRGPAGPQGLPGLEVRPAPAPTPPAPREIRARPVHPVAPPAALPPSSGTVMAEAPQALPAPALAPAAGAPQAPVASAPPALPQVHVVPVLPPAPAVEPLPPAAVQP